MWLTQHLASGIAWESSLPPACLPLAVCISLSLTSRLLAMKLGEFAGPDFWSQAEASSKDSQGTQSLCDARPQA